MDQSVNTSSEHEQELSKINAMSRLDMARLWRHASSGHPWFDSSKPYHKVFAERFKSLGGFSPEISKQIGWNLQHRLI